MQIKLFCLVWRGEFDEEQISRTPLNIPWHEVAVLVLLAWFRQEEEEEEEEAEKATEAAKETVYLLSTSFSVGKRYVLRS